MYTDYTEMGLEPGYQPYSSSWNIPTCPNWWLMRLLEAVIIPPPTKKIFQNQDYRHWNVNQRHSPTVQQSNISKGWLMKGNKNLWNRPNGYCTLHQWVPTRPTKCKLKDPILSEIEKIMRIFLKKEPLVIGRKKSPTELHFTPVVHHFFEETI